MKCLQCHRDFTSSHGNVRLCSDHCKQQRKNQQAKEDRKSCKKASRCQHCKYKFMPYRTDQKWCSDHCKFENYKRQKRLANKEKHMNSIKMCQHCNEEFAPRRHIHESFCSNNCKIEFYKEVRKQETDLIRSQSIKTCPVCENEFTPKKTLKQKYCSKRCCNLFPKKIYKALQTCLKYTGEEKLDHAHKLLGYTPRQLREHIQSHSNWPNVKSGDWHLDHIFPIIAFVERGIKDISVICSLDNLQPLTGRRNCIKNANYDQSVFEQYLANKE